jgi:hypothetical protein
MAGRKIASGRRGADETRTQTREGLMQPLIVHTLDEAMDALSKAKKSIVLQSGSNAIFYAGPLYLLKLFEAAQAAYPNVDATFVLDCGNAGAEAIAAIEMGHKHIRSNNAKIIDIARQNGVALHGLKDVETVDKTG